VYAALELDAKEQEQETAFQLFRFRGSPTIRSCNLSSALVREAIGEAGNAVGKHDKGVKAKNKIAKTENSRSSTDKS